MIQHFFTSDDVPNVTTAHSWVDEDASWWVGVQNAGATMALAAALSLAASQAAIATQVFSFHQDDPALTASYQDEQTWQNQVAPYVAPNIVPAPWSFDEQTPALTAGYLDEGLWINPVQLVQSWSPPQLIGDDNEIFQQPVTGIADDNEIWQPLVLAYVAATIPIPPWMSDQADIVPQPVAGKQNYINTGLNNFISQEIGEGVQF